MTYENLILEVDAGIAVLTLNRPKALNALNTKTLQELNAALTEVVNNAELRALIVTGSGEKAFVAGADIAEMAAYTPGQAQEFSALGHKTFAQLETLAVPTIAAVNGFALGGGCELALACDLIYASERAKFGLPEVGLGVIPGFGGTQRLTRVVGKMRAKELIFTGDMIEAKAAKEFGLALDVVAPEKLIEHCKSIAGKIAKKGPLAIAQAKRVIEAGADIELKAANSLEQQAFASLFSSADQKEGMRAFSEKRAAAFRGA